MWKLPKMEELPEELQRRIRNKNDRYRFKLMQVAVEFVGRLPISPLTTSIDYLRGFLPYPGVYLIYYVGTTSLYGNLVNPSQGRPIYIGMSRTDILDRLKNHRKKVEDAEDLDVRNFDRCSISNCGHRTLCALYRGGTYRVL